MTTSTVSGTVNLPISLKDGRSVKPGTPKYQVYDKLPTIGNPGESWDMFIVRKMKEEREYKERTRDE